MVWFHAVNLFIFCCIFVFGKLSGETLHNFLAESQTIIFSVIFDELDELVVFEEILFSPNRTFWWRL